jgi:hypothetical protein
VFFRGGGVAPARAHAPACVRRRACARARAAPPCANRPTQTVLPYLSKPKKTSFPTKPPHQTAPPNRPTKPPPHPTGPHPTTLPNHPAKPPHQTASPDDLAKPPHQTAPPNPRSPPSFYYGRLETYAWRDQYAGQFTKFETMMDALARDGGTPAPAEVNFSSGGHYPQTGKSGDRQGFEVLVTADTRKQAGQWQRYEATVTVGGLGEGAVRFRGGPLWSTPVRGVCVGGVSGLSWVWEVLVGRAGGEVLVGGRPASRGVRHYRERHLWPVCHPQPSRPCQPPASLRRARPAASCSSRSPPPRAPRSVAAAARCWMRCACRRVGAPSAGGPAARAFVGLGGARPALWGLGRKAGFSRKLLVDCCRGAVAVPPRTTTHRRSPRPTPPPLPRSLSYLLACPQAGRGAAPGPTLGAARTNANATPNQC